MNNPPIGGQLTVTPDVGLAFNTTFSFTTFSWQDDVSDLPLRYMFSYFVLDPQLELNIIKSLDLLSTMTTLLGQGLSSMHFYVTCVAVAVDTFDGLANVTTSAMVHPLKISANLISSMNSARDQAFAQENIYGITQVVNSVLGSLNSVDCMVPSPCYQLNRRECMATAQTCGPCSAGFVGISGDSNVACRSSQSLSQTGATCSGNSSCISNSCIKSADHVLRCTDAVKSCPNDCGGVGVCVFKDDNGLTISKCSVSNPYCQAVCVVHQTYLAKIVP